jgi:hypothetical protein
MQPYVYVTRHIYVDALKLWRLGGHWSVNQSSAWRYAAAVDEAVSPGEFTWALCPRGSLCFLGTWLILGLPLSLQSFGVLPAWKWSKCLLPFSGCIKLLVCVLHYRCLLKVSLESAYRVCPLKMKVYKIFMHADNKYKAFLGAYNCGVSQAIFSVISSFRLVCFAWDRLSLHSPGWLGTCYAGRLGTQSLCLPLLPRN